MFFDLRSGTPISGLKMGSTHLIQMYFIVIVVVKTEETTKTLVTLHVVHYITQIRYKSLALCTALTFNSSLESILNVFLTGAFIHITSCIYQPEISSN